MKQSITFPKTEKRGGARSSVTKPRKASTSKVLDFLFKRYGGTFLIAESLQIHSQAVSRWISQGYVPMKWVGPVARLLGVTHAALNYEGHILYTGGNGDWKSVVIEAVFPDNYKHLLEGRMPRTPKEILK